jgi:large subunit ribosomal protein L25
MHEDIILNATTRSVIGKQVKALRREGQFPAIIYGKVLEKPIPILLNTHDASKILNKVGATTLVQVEVDGKTYPSLVREKQRDIIYGTYLHVDFLTISMTERLRAMVRIELVGEAPAVKEYNAIVVTGTTEVEIECLPTDLPELLEVDLSGLMEIGDSLTVADLPIPDRVTLLSDTEEMVVQVTAPMAEEVEEEVEAVEEDEAEPEVIEKGKAEEEAAE